MRFLNQPSRIASILLVAAGAVLIVLNIATHGTFNVALPLVFLALGCGCFVGAEMARPRWCFATLLYIPAALLLAFGVIFLLDVLTGDWNSWAYAWLMLVAAPGFGAALAARGQPWPGWVSLAGWGTGAGGLVLFCIFGAIAGGLFIQVMAPALLVCAGLLARGLLPDQWLAERFRRPTAPPAAVHGLAQPAGELFEPVSEREREVLALIDAGLSNAQIALRLNIAPSTVKTHINNLYGKLGAANRVQALNRARESGLLG